MAYTGSTPEDPDVINDILYSQYSMSKATASGDTVSGDEYSTGHLFTDVASNGGTATLLIENPSDSGVYIFLNGFFRCEGKAYIQKSLNVTVDSSGTNVDVQQRRSDMTDGNETNVQHTVSVSGGRRFTKKVVGSGGGGQGLRNPGAGGGPATIVAPGDNAFYEAENPTSNTQDITIDVDFTQISEQLINELTENE